MRGTVINFCVLQQQNQGRRVDQQNKQQVASAAVRSKAVVLLSIH